MRRMNMKYKMLDALRAKYEADYKQAHATLNVYLTNPVGIGEHPQHFEEMGKLVDAMAAARDSLDTINSEYPSGQQILTEENELGDSGC